MRGFDYNFLIDNKPVLLPDADVTWEYNDLDSSDTGRDESGVMRRIVIREGVRKCSLSYGFLTREEYLYMRSLFAGKPQFEVTCTDHDGRIEKFTAYHSNHSIVVRNAKEGYYKNYNPKIIEC